MPFITTMFLLAIEPLAISIKNNINIKGLDIANYHHKICLFADDVILFITQPLTMLRNLNLELVAFQKNSGLYINNIKSNALNINMSNTNIIHIKTHFPFAWEDFSLSYLGIKLTSSYAFLYNANFPSIIRHFKSLLET